MSYSPTYNSLVTSYPDLTADPSSGTAAKSGVGGSGTVAYTYGGAGKPDPGELAQSFNGTFGKNLLTALYGQKPGMLAQPSPYKDLSSVYPNLSASNQAVSGDILSKLKGDLSPETINAIQDNAARFGIDSGMPGSGLQWNKSLRDIGQTTEQEQQQGIQDYNSTIPTVSKTQTESPELEAQIAELNAMIAASPDPVASGLLNTFLSMYGGGKGGGGSSGGGFGGGGQGGGSSFSSSMMGGFGF